MHCSSGYLANFFTQVAALALKRLKNSSPLKAMNRYANDSIRGEHGSGSSGFGRVRVGSKSTVTKYM